MTAIVVMFLAITIVGFLSYNGGVRVGINRATTVTPALAKGCSHESLKYDCLLEVKDLYDPYQGPKKFRVACFCTGCGKAREVDVPVYVVDGQTDETKMRRITEAMHALGWLWDEEDHLFIKA